MEMEEVQPLPVDDDLAVPKINDEEDLIEGQLSVLELDTAEMDYQKWHQLLQASLKQNKAKPLKQVPATGVQEETVTQEDVKPRTFDVVQPIVPPVEPLPQEVSAATKKAQEEAERPKSLTELAVEQWRNEREKREQQGRLRLGLNVEEPAPDQLPPAAVVPVVPATLPVAVEVPAVIKPVVPEDDDDKEPLTLAQKISAKMGLDEAGQPMTEAQRIAADAERKRRNAVLAMVRKRKEAAMRGRP
jgi:hypothetical protein